MAGHAVQSDHTTTEQDSCSISPLTMTSRMLFSQLPETLAAVPKNSNLKLVFLINNFEFKLTSYIWAIFDSEFTIRELAMRSSVSFGAIPISTSCSRSIMNDFKLMRMVLGKKSYPVQRCCVIFLCPEPQTGQLLTVVLPPIFA